MAAISAAVEGLQKRDFDSVLTGGIDGNNSNRQAVNQLPTLADFEPKPDTETAPSLHQRKRILTGRLRK